ncbi:MAG: hypothetical protein F2923_03180 [Actinobacteria bacterium]|uniref:Unannotated protein n=1 Tax=freshwater metagenome TaxID=449393 RepID=A0A6J7F383_9ZZZZ|nr:hypothetical protein [Actinomycetota bacterium]MTB27626.1 hypothetical protein [Actinomycetota bacterium]
MTRLFAFLLVPALMLFGQLPAYAAVPPWKVQCTFTDARFDEISGITRSTQFPGVLYLHNDSSGGPRIYAVDEKSCQTKATFTISDARARDYEAISVGKDSKGRNVIWLGDIGDNRDSWPYVEILKIREPSVLKSQDVKASTYRVKYPDIPHNSETLLASQSSSQLWLVTKQLAHGSLYALPNPLRSTNTAKNLRTEGGLITDGAVSPQGDRYVLRTYFDATIYSGLPPGKAGITFELPGQLQGEAVAWTSDGKALLIASERDHRLLRVEIPQVA